MASHLRLGIISGGSSKHEAHALLLEYVLGAKSLEAVAERIGLSMLIRGCRIFDLCALQRPSTNL